MQYENKTNINLNNKTILVTGTAGFIGANLVLKLLHTYSNNTIIGIDNLNDYYDVSIKEWRLKEIEKISGGAGNKWTFIKGSIADRPTIDNIFSTYHPDIVVNLAAQAGVRYSITNPDVYVESNLIGFYNILEACRHSYDGVGEEKNNKGVDEHSTDKTNKENKDHAEVSEKEYKGVQHLVYASSSSVYGSNKKVPYSTDDKVDNPVSLYAATKKSNELLAHAYSKLYNIPSTGLRFFTVYGPAGRPDMAYFGFTNKLIKGKNDTPAVRDEDGNILKDENGFFVDKKGNQLKDNQGKAIKEAIVTPEAVIKIFNYGNCKRDFTYVDDIVEGVVRVMGGAPEKKNGEDGLPIPPYSTYNIGNSSPENLLDFVTVLQEELIRAGVLPEDYDFESHKELVPMQPGDVPVTYADTSALERDYGFKPGTSLREGLRKFAEWYKEFYL